MSPDLKNYLGVVALAVTGAAEPGVAGVRQPAGAQPEVQRLRRGACVDRHLDQHAAVAVGARREAAIDDADDPLQIRPRGGVTAGARASARPQLRDERRRAAPAARAFD